MGLRHVGNANDMSNLLPKSVNIFDDTMREGLQIESPDIPVSEKLRLLDAIGEMGAKNHIDLLLRASCSYSFGFA